MTTLHLPWPPSVNRYWRAWRGRVVLAPQGRQYRDDVAVIAAFARVRDLQLEGRLGVEIEACPPDHRRRDADNVLKALLDALQHAGLYADDYQIADLHVRRLDPVPRGRVTVTIRRLEDDAEGVVGA